MAIYSSGTNPTYYSLGNLIAPNVNSAAMAAQAKAKAYVDLETINAAAKPDLKEYEEKLKAKALTGNKQSLLYEYRSITNDLKKGAAKYGNDWISYSNSKEYQESMGRFNNFLLNVNTAEQRYNTWQKEYETMDDNEKNAIYIGEGFAPIPKLLNGKFTGEYYTNQEYFENLERRSLSKDGIFDLDLPQLHKGSNEDLVKGVQSFAANLGITVTDEGFSISPEQLGKGVAGDFYSYLTTTEAKRTSNKTQLRNAGEAFLMAMDDKAKTALTRNYFEYVKAKKEKGETPLTLQEYAPEVAKNILKPMAIDKTDVSRSFHKGKDGLGADGLSNKLDYFGMLFGNDKLIDQGAAVTMPTFDGTNVYNSTVQPKGLGQAKGLTKAYPAGTPISEINGTFTFMNKRYNANDQTFANKNLVLNKINNVFTAYAELNPTTGQWDQMANDKEVMKAMYKLPITATDAELNKRRAEGPPEPTTGPLILTDGKGNTIKKFLVTPFMSAEAKTTGVPELNGIDFEGGKPKERKFLDPSVIDLDDIKGGEAYFDDWGNTINQKAQEAGKGLVASVESNPDTPWYGFSKNYDYAKFQIIIPVTNTGLLMNDDFGASSNYSALKANSDQAQLIKTMTDLRKKEQNLTNAYDAYGIK